MKLNKVLHLKHCLEHTRFIAKGDTCSLVYGEKKIGSNLYNDSSINNILGTTLVSDKFEEDLDLKRIDIYHHIDETGKLRGYSMELMDHHD